MKKPDPQKATGPVIGVTRPVWKQSQSSLKAPKNDYSNKLYA